MPRAATTLGKGRPTSLLALARASRTSVELSVPPLASLEAEDGPLVKVLLSDTPSSLSSVSVGATAGDQRLGS